MLILAAISALVLLPQAVSSPAEDPKLTASVGPGFSISLVDATGQPVRQLDPGTYAIAVRDLSANHSFHLSGPGVDERTEIETESEATWTVTFSVGRYRYQCDQHPTSMRAEFSVGDVPPDPTPAPAPAPKPQQLVAVVGPGATIALKRSSGGPIRAGQTTISVRDRSAKDNFHLTGPGFNRKTTRVGKGTATWKVKLVAGKRYTYRSDATKALKRTFVPR